MTNEKVRIHVINVGHGDSILVEFPDYRDGNQYRPSFGLVDAGGEDASVKNKTMNYLKNFLTARLGGSYEDFEPNAFRFEFLCLTHPHRDHLLGIMPILEAFGDRIDQFWDCGFRHNTVSYLAILEYLTAHPGIQFMRVTSGTEFHFGDVEVMVLSPSIDMRNRYETYGVDINSASIVLRITRGNGVAILAGDAHFDAWGKVSEEFPRTKRIQYAKNQDIIYTRPGESGSSEVPFVSRTNQLACGLLKVSHHGSKNGTAYEYLEKLSPNTFMITCDHDSWYKEKKSSWAGKFPHPLTRLSIGESNGTYNSTGVNKGKIPTLKALGDKVLASSVSGSVIFELMGNNTIKQVAEFKEKRGAGVTAEKIASAL